MGCMEMESISENIKISSFTKPYVPSTILRLGNHPKVSREALKTRKSFFFLPAHSNLHNSVPSRRCGCVCAKEQHETDPHDVLKSKGSRESCGMELNNRKTTILTVERVVLVRDWMETEASGCVCVSEAKMKEREILSGRVFHHPSHKHFRKIFARWQVTAFEFLELVCFAFVSVGLNFKWGSLRCMFPSRTAFH